MPAQKAQSGLLAKAAGAALMQAHGKAKDDKSEPNAQGGLPPGIETGIAQLRECCIKTIQKEGKNKGKPVFYASAVCVSPKKHLYGGELITTEGIQSRVMENLFDTPEAKGKRKSFSDHYAFMLAHLRWLGFDVAQIAVTTPEGIEAALIAGMAALTKQKPHFRFRTWKGDATSEFPNPRVNEEWGAACEYSAEAAQTQAMDAVEESAPNATADHSSNGEGAQASGAPASEEVNLEALAEAANNDPEGAEAEKLGKLALSLGIAEDTVTNAESWSAVVELIKAAQAGTPDEQKGESESAGEIEETAEAEEPETWTPKVGETASYKPLDQKTKKPQKKAVKVEITAVSEKDSSVTLKRLDNKAVVKGVKFDRLEH